MPKWRRALVCRGGRMDSFGSDVGPVTRRLDASIPGRLPKSNVLLDVPPNGGLEGVMPAFDDAVLSAAHTLRRLSIGLAVMDYDLYPDDDACSSPSSSWTACLNAGDRGVEISARGSIVDSMLLYA